MADQGKTALLSCHQRDVCIDKQKESMNKLYLITTLIAPLFGFFGNLLNWFQRNKQPVVQQTMHEQIKKNLIVKNIHPYHSFSKQEKSTGLDELGVRVPSIPSFGRHDKVFELKERLIDRGPLIPLSERHTAYNKKHINEEEWDEYRRNRYNKRYYNHKMGVDKHGEPYRLNDEDN